MQNSYNVYRVSAFNDGSTGSTGYKWFLKSENDARAHLCLMMQSNRDVSIVQTELKNVNIATVDECAEIARNVWPNDEYNEAMLINDGDFYPLNETTEFVNRMRANGFDGGHVMAPNPGDYTRMVEILFVFNA